MNDYASLRKKNSARTVAVIMVLLFVVEMCSLAMLFSRVLSYSTDASRYVISLTEGADFSRLSEVNSADTGFIVPTSVVDPDTLIEAVDSVNTIDYGFETRDDKQIWTTDTNIEVFRLSYDEKGDVTVISSDGDKVFAPGTGNTYSFSVKNTGSHALDYLVYIEASIIAKDADGNDLMIPLEARFRRGDGTFFVGSADSWSDYLALDKTGDLNSISSGSQIDYYVDWQWPFERTDGDGLDANDAYDTMLGSLADTGRDLKATIRIKTCAWFEDYYHVVVDVIEGSGTASATPDSVLMYSAGTFTLTAVPDEGYEFVGWQIDDGCIYDIVSGTLSDATLVIRPGSDIYAHAIFRPIATQPGIEYWIATADVKSGEGTATVTPAQVEQNSNDTFTFVATPAEGYEFVGWEFDDGDIYEIINGTLNTATLVVKPGSDLHAHAVFRPIATQPGIEYWIATADVKSGEGTATVTPAQVEQNSNDTFTFVATPAEGYEFVGWEFDNGDIYEIIDGSLSSATLVVKPGSDLHAHAIFKPIATVAPTEMPTEKPTEKPTEIPTEEPTEKPTEEPSVEPTVEPTVEPSVAPTQAPTTPSGQPKTGDTTNTMFWLFLAIGTFIALVVLFFVYRKLRKAEKSDQSING